VYPRDHTIMDWTQRAVFWLVFLSTCVGPTVASAVERSPEPNMLTKFESDWPVGDVRRCQEQLHKSEFSAKRFEVIPGIGWDNLRNVEAGLVVSYNYTLCKQTDDGRLLVPDNVFTVPIKYSSVETFAELCDHWLNTSSITSNTINVGASLSLLYKSISGSFSYENEQIKSKQIEDKAVTTRVQLRYYRYEAKLQADPVLSPQFKNRLMSIAANIQINNIEQARYEGQLLVRDFGTHVLTSVTAGAALVKDDYLKRDFVLSQSEQKSSILAKASASFFSIFNLSASYGHTYDSSISELYEKSMTHSYIKSHGGPMIQATDMTVNDWIAGVDDNLVPMDRSGDPLYFLVTPTVLPELPVTIVGELETIVRQSIELYYGMNAIPGCTKLGSPSFSFSANFDDGSCQSRPTNLSFGGVFQQCSVSGQYLYNNPCDGLSAVNPKTGGLSCPSSYTAIQLQSSRTTGQTENRRKCESCWLWSTCCHDEQFYSDAVYSTYWCAATGKVEKYSGYLFGGLYTSTHDNLVTGIKGCPPSFYPRQMFKDLQVCISDDYELGESYSVPFGGFFSCLTGNPLAVDGVVPVGVKLNDGSAHQLPKLRSFMEAQSGSRTYPSRCPEGYSQHLATDDLGCSIHYCVQTGALSAPNIPPVKRPPFMPKPAVIMGEGEHEVMVNYKAKTWTKNETMHQLQAKFMATSMDSGKNSAKEMSPGAVAGISVGATLASVAITTLIVVMVRRRQAKKRQSPYGRITDETSESAISYGSTAAETTAINV
jgi:hypothetical protein